MEIEIEIPEHWSFEQRVLHLLREILINQKITNKRLDAIEDQLDRIEQELEKMAQVQLTIGFTVAQGGTGTALTVTPSSVNEDLTVGKAVDGTVVATVTGGVPPYTIPLDAGSGALPDGVGLAIDANGVITLTGTPTTASDSVVQVIVDVTDSGAPTGPQLRAKTK